jgi:hypothetical protein
MRMDLQTQYFQDIVNTDITFQVLKERSRTTGRGLFPRFARPEASSAPNSAGPFLPATPTLHSLFSVNPSSASRGGRVLPVFSRCSVFRHPPQRDVPSRNALPVTIRFAITNG